MPHYVVLFHPKVDVWQRTYADDTQSDIGVESRLQKLAPKSTQTSVPSVMRIWIRNQHENSAPKTGAD